MEKERKLQIIRAALKRFIKHGIKKTTLDEVARDLRIGKATLYHYFQSKEDLYYQSLRFEVELYINDLKNIFSNAEKNLPDKINEYFLIKENFQNRYKLVYELIVHILNNSDFMNEKDIYAELLDSEQKYLREVFKSSIKVKDITPDWASQYLIAQGWYFVFNESFRLDGSTNDLLRSQINEYLLKYI